MREPSGHAWTTSLGALAYPDLVALDDGGLLVAGGSSGGVDLTDVGPDGTIRARWTVDAVATTPDDGAFPNGDRLRIGSHVERVSPEGVARWSTLVANLSPVGATITDDRVFVHSARFECGCWSCRSTADFLGVQMLGPGGESLGTCGHVGVDGEVAAVLGDLVLVDGFWGTLSSFRCRDGRPSEIRPLIDNRHTVLLGAAIHGGEVHAVFYAGSGFTPGELAPGVYAAAIVEDALDTPTVLSLEPADRWGQVGRYRRGNAIFLDDGAVVVLSPCDDGTRDQCLRRIYPAW